MFRLFLSFTGGAILASLAFMWVLIPTIRENWRAQGFNEGSINARWDISEKLKKEFPFGSSKCESQRVLFEVKTNTVYISECPDGRKIHVQR